MPRLLPTISPFGQMGERVVRRGYQGKEEGFFGSEFTAKDLSDVFTLAQQGVGLIKEAEPIADYFTKRSAEADKQAALKEIADKRAKINAEKAAQVKAAQNKLRELQQIGQQTAENRKLMGMMPEVPDVALQEPALGSSLADPGSTRISKKDDGRVRRDDIVVPSGISLGLIDPEMQEAIDRVAPGTGPQAGDPQVRALRERLLAAQPSRELSVDMPGPVDPSAMLQDMGGAAPSPGRRDFTPQEVVQINLESFRRAGLSERGPGTPEEVDKTNIALRQIYAEIDAGTHPLSRRQPTRQERLVQAAQQRVGRGPAGTRMRKDGYFSHTPNKATLQALSELEKERQLEPGTLQNIYLGSIPRYTAGTPGQRFPSEEFLELKNPYELNQYRPLVKTVEEAELFQRLMEAAIQREGGYGFLGKFDRQDELRKYFDKNFNFQGKIAPKEVKEGKGIGFGDARKIIGKKKRVTTGGGGGNRNQELYEDNILVVNEITARMPDGSVQKQQAHDMSEEYLGYQARVRAVGKKQARKEIADKLKSNDPAQVAEAKAVLGMDTGATNKAALRRLSAFSNATSKRINKARKEGNKGNIKGTASLVQRGQIEKDKAAALAKHRREANARADRTYNLNVSKFNASAVKGAKDRAHKAGQVAYDAGAQYDSPEQKKQRYQEAYDRTLKAEMESIKAKPVVPVDGTSGRKTFEGSASINESTPAN